MRRQSATTLSLHPQSIGVPKALAIPCPSRARRHNWLKIMAKVDRPCGFRLRCCPGTGSSLRPGSPPESATSCGLRQTDASGNVHLFDAFGPRRLNGIDLLAHLAPATRTRCITVGMLPLLEEEKDSVTSIRYAADDENFVILQRKFLRWAIDNMAGLKSAKPRMPD